MYLLLLHLFFLIFLTAYISKSLCRLQKLQLWVLKNKLYNQSLFTLGWSVFLIHLLIHSLTQKAEVDQDGMQCDGTAHRTVYVSESYMDFYCRAHGTRCHCRSLDCVQFSFSIYIYFICFCFSQPHVLQCSRWEDAALGAPNLSNSSSQWRGHMWSTELLLFAFFSSALLFSASLFTTKTSKKQKLSEAFFKPACLQYHLSFTGQLVYSTRMVCTNVYNINEEVLI